MGRAASMGRGGKHEGKNKGTPDLMLMTGEASKILHVHGNTLRRWNKQGIIKSYRIGPSGERRFKREDVLALLKEAKPPKKVIGGRRNESNRR